MKDKSWMNTILPIESTIEDAIQRLNETSLKILLIADSERILIGTICDGDIRRGLLKGLNIASPISGIINLNPIIVEESSSSRLVNEIMIANKVFQIPIVDRKKRLIGLHLFHDVTHPTSYKNKMIIIAGGKGSRLLPKTSTVPKSMLKIAGKPILELIIMRAKNQGFSNFTLAIHHLGEVIEEYFGDGSSLKVDIEYIREKLPLGTAGALSLLKPTPDEPIIVTNGDVLTDINYGRMLEFHMQNEATATMAVQVQEWQQPFGVISTNGIQITGFEEKPNMRALVNAGVYILNPSVLSVLDYNIHIDMPTLFDSLRMNNSKTIAYILHENWIDIGTPEQFEYASESYQIPNFNDLI
jgi:dTDP-glucose pyrophosphorylase